MARVIRRDLLSWLDNTIVGADEPANTDEIHGELGNDILIGQAGDDVLFGGFGDDTLEGGNNNDILSGGMGFDRMFGGAGHDKIYAQSTAAAVAGSDTGLEGEPVYDFPILGLANALLDSGGVMDGGSGDDTFFVDVAFSGLLEIDGGGDIDKIDFGSNTNNWTGPIPTSVPTNLLDLDSGIGETPFGGEISETLVEHITGGIYRDEFFGDHSANTLRGMANDDVLEGRGGGDTLDGGSGHDVAQYTSSTSGVTVDLQRATQPNLGGDAAGDRLISIEEVRGSRFGDTIRGTSGVEVLVGDRGDDTLEGRGGGDTLDGGIGFDFASYESSTAAVNVNLAPGSNLNGGHATGDTLVSIEGLIGSAHADNLFGTDGENELRGGGGGDKIFGNGGKDILRAGDGADELNGGRQDDTLDGGFGNDILDGQQEIDTADFSSWDGRLSGQQSIRIELGLNGADGMAQRKLLTSVFAAETDVLRSIENVIGSNFAETIKGNGQANDLKGRGGNDRLEGGDENDVLNGGAGTDTLLGGTGQDQFVFDAAPGSTNVDTILDFSVVNDTILLDDAVFTGLADPTVDLRTLRSSEFVFGTAAQDASDRIIYNSVAGALLYDADGTGQIAAVQFATIGTLLNLSTNDFVVF